MGLVCSRVVYDWYWSDSPDAVSSRYASMKLTLTAPDVSRPSRSSGRPSASPRLDSTLAVPSAMLADFTSMTGPGPAWRTPPSGHSVTSPGSPAGPVAPGSPAGPVGPGSAGPAGPGSPIGPWAPGGPCTPSAPSSPEQAAIPIVRSKNQVGAPSRRRAVHLASLMIRSPLNAQRGVAGVTGT